MNVIDVVVAIALIGAVIRGYQVGLVRQLGSTIGFVTGLFASIPLGQWTSSLVSEQLEKTIVSTVTLIVVSLTFMTIGEYVGLRLKVHMTIGKLVDRADSIIGAGMAIVTFIIGIWFATAFISLLSANGGQQLFRQSFTFNFVDRHLPPASQALAGLNHFIDPNTTPLIFSGREPSPDTNKQLPSLDQYAAVIARTAPSVVRVQGLGCGGIVNGSGWVLSPNRVVTNAHVVAGVINPKVYDDNGTHDAKVVAFDAKADIAVLATSHLAGRPLTLNTDFLAPGATALVIGYPGGGPQRTNAAIVLEQVDALGRDIYARNKTVRNVYILQTTIIPGNSGGPLLDAEGRVVGVVFGTSTTYNNVGYALSLSQIGNMLAASQTATDAVPTGACSKE